MGIYYHICSRGQYKSLTVIGMSNPHSKLGDRIRKLIEDAGVSQRELARKLKVGPNQVSRWVLGSVAPTYTVLHDILKICKQPQESGWLLTGSFYKQEVSEASEVNNNTGEPTVTERDEEEMIYQKKYEILMEKHIAMMEENSILKEKLIKKAPLSKMEVS